ncbi:hypothetical protein CRM22_000897 [Opisthorchis felineus]|uniref:Uncharacterized protein n=1 Tax=Opisthorchis felineus TaxID=147828 RepID=A0A4S2MD93_OPIFE|nr:hypothetical protein CRM22_000897 [Opisthorchis felineus]
MVVLMIMSSFFGHIFYCWQLSRSGDRTVLWPAERFHDHHIRQDRRIRFASRRWHPQVRRN